MNTDPTLAPWVSLVGDVLTRTGQEGTPDVRWSEGAVCTYRYRDDRLTIGRGFALQWPVTTPQARFTIAHELGHRALHHDYSEVRARGRHGVVPFLTVALGSIAAAAIVVSDLPLLVRTGATSLMILATLTAVEIITTRRVQGELHANEYAADDFATAAVGVAGADILATLYAPTGLSKVGSTHPLGADRYARQIDRARERDTPAAESDVPGPEHHG